ncbi:hypothetical protein K1T35_18340 [Pseudonocardia sp. DSM 110487]|uniref:hypothetical protein n=1 Tax=Pseudonocardia sp. DSM 110487 TaxID=2865833 RepID=UPI001C69A9B4|nr:hypothetical protein [Pseudonocardia sp. DSM 110487]QYN38982.1 hypothetical protein K1T35_18340 [Pseudonocardia sp. DSM 110487]
MELPGDGPRDGLSEALAAAAAVEDATQRAQRMLATVREFMARVDDDALGHRLGPLQDALIEVGAELPDEAVRELVAVSWRCDVDERAAQDVLVHWLRRPRAETFAATWGPVSGLLTQSTALCGWLTRTMLDEHAAEFRELAREHLTRLLDGQFEKYEFSATSPVWKVLYALGPADRAHWFCLVGDLAAERGDEAAAAHRYELADRYGGTGIQERRERLLDRSAHRQLREGTTSAVRLAGDGTPTAYRQMLLAAAAVLRGEAAQALPDDLDPAGDERLRTPTLLIHALGLLRRGRPDAARRHLDLMLTAPVSSAADQDLMTNAELVLGALDGDDQRIATAVRTLHARHGDGWQARSLVAPALVVAAVARVDAALLPELGTSAPGGALDAVRRAAAATALATAAQAVLLGRPGEQERLIEEARRLLTGAGHAEAERRAADRITELAATLSGDHAPQRPVDRLAYAALNQDGAVHPVTPDALRLWRELDAESAGDQRSLHHLAIAEHALAHRLELDGDDTAPEQWRRALRCWARLGADPAFWSDLRTHLAAVVPDATVDDIAGAVAHAQAQLPAHLLEPHVTRVLQLRRGEPERAREHMEILRSAPLPADVIAAARLRLTREAISSVRGLLREDHLDRALEEARSWAAVDAENVPLAELLLDVGIEHVEKGARDDEFAWAADARPLLEQLAEVVEPIRAALNLTGRELITHRRAQVADGDHAAFSAKLARFEFWLGKSQLYTTYDRRRTDPFHSLHGYRTAGRHLDVAILLGLPSRAPFSSARHLLVLAGKLASGSSMGFF